MIGIYKIENKTTNKVYIGGSRKLEARFQVHLSQLRLNKHHCKELQLEFNSYGVEQFVFSIVEECIDDILVISEREKYHLDANRNKAYNTYTNCGHKSHDTLETRKAKSNAMMGNKNGLGRVVSEEAKEKARQLNLGKTYGEETKRKQREAKLGKESLRKLAIIQISLTNHEAIKEFKSATDAAKEIGVARNNIVKVLKGERKQCGGFSWRYKD